MSFSIENRPTQPVIYIRKRAPQEKLPQLIGESYMKLAQYLEVKGRQLAGEPYAAYYNLDPLDLDVEVGFPVAAPLPEEGDIRFREIPAGRSATTLYKGPYAMMEPTYQEFMAWLAEKGLSLAGPVYEHYLNSPQEVPESELLTRIVMPVEPG